METRFCTVETDGKVMIVTLNHPEKRKPVWADPS